jgi:hypothetical protein
VRYAVFRGEPVDWVSRRGRLDSMRLRMTGADGVARDTTLCAQRDTANLTGVSPGTYRYDATGFAGDARYAAAGTFTIETYSPEFARAAAELVPGGSAARSLGDDAAQNGVRARDARDARPLHTSPLPYVFLLVLLAAEWLLRRRWGLR